MHCDVASWWNHPLWPMRGVGEVRVAGEGARPSASAITWRRRENIKINYIRGGNVLAAVWSVLSLNRGPNVWRAECETSAFKIDRFLEVYSENSSQRRRLWRHGGRTSARAPRWSARGRFGARLWASVAFLRPVLLGMTVGPLRCGVQGRPPAAPLAACLWAEPGIPGNARLLRSIRFPGIIAWMAPPRRAALARSSFWEFTASTLKIIGMHRAILVI